MIVIEPVGLPERSRYPGGYLLRPGLVPPSPELERQLPSLERKSSLWFFLLLGGAVAAIGSSGSKSPGLGEARRSSAHPKKQPGKRLYYMWLPPGKWFEEAVSIRKSKLAEYQRRVIATQRDRRPGRLFYIWSESAGRARYDLRIDPTERHKWQPNWEQRSPAAATSEGQLTLFGTGCRDKDGKFIPIPRCINRPSALLKAEDALEIFKTKKKAKGMKGFQPTMGQTYDVDIEQALVEIINVKPRTTYFLIPKSAKRTLITSVEPEKGTGYLTIDRKGIISSYDKQNKLRMQKTAAHLVKPEATERKLSEYWFYIPWGRQKATRVDETHLKADPAFYYGAEERKQGRLYKAEGYSEVDAKRQFMQQMQKARDYRKKWAGPNRYELPYYTWKKGLGYRIVRRAEHHPLPWDREKPGTVIPDMGGDVANCAIWLPDDRGGYKCGAYARVCEPPACADPPDPITKQIKVCTKTQKVYSGFYDKLITRCKQYKAACKGAACMPSPMPYPEEEARRIPSPEEVQSMAVWMAEQYNEETFEKEPLLAREILSRGGIRSYKKGMEKEEYKAIPLFLKNREGLPADEMASEMKFDTDRDLLEAIALEYPKKEKGAWKKLQRKTWQDFEDAAYEMISEGMEAGTWADLKQALSVGETREEWIARHEAPGSWRHMWKLPGKEPKQVDDEVAYRLHRDYSGEGAMYFLRATSANEARRIIESGKIAPLEWEPRKPRKGEPEQLKFLGQELFPELRRELVLEPPEDVATSDDPVIACMERQGWRMPRIEELKASISEKMTPDLFTGKIQKLTSAEKEYQRIVGECLEARSGTAGIFGSIGALSIQAQAIRASQRDTRAMSMYLADNGIKINADQTVTLYHGTSKKNAQAIRESGKIRATTGKNVMERIEDAAWVTPDKAFAKTWGSQIVTVKVPVKFLRHLPQNFREFYFVGGLKQDRLRPSEWIPERYPLENWVIKVARADYDAGLSVEPEQLKLLGRDLTDPPPAWLTRQPFTDEESQKYRDYVGNQNYSITGEFLRRKTDKEFEISQQMRSRNVAVRPRDVDLAMDEYQRLLHVLYKFSPRNPGRVDELRELVREAERDLDEKIAAIRKPKLQTGSAFEQTKERVWMLLFVRKEPLHIDNIAKTLSIEYHHARAALDALVKEGSVNPESAMRYSSDKAREPEQLKLLGYDRGLYTRSYLEALNV